MFLHIYKNAKHFAHKIEGHNIIQYFEYMIVVLLPMPLTVDSNIYTSPKQQNLHVLLQYMQSPKKKVM